MIDEWEKQPIWIDPDGTGYKSMHPVPAHWIRYIPHEAAAGEIERLHKILEKVDQYTPVADSTCDEPGITFTEAIMRQWPELRPPSP